MEQAEQGARRPLSPGPQSRPPSLAQALPPQCPPRPWSHAAFPAALAWGEDVPAECAEWWDWQRLEGFWPCFPGSPPHCLPPHGEEPLPEAPVSGTSPRPLYRAELERTRSGAGEASRPPAAWPRALPREGRAVRAEPRLRLVDSDPPAAEASSRPFSFRGNVLLRKRPPFTRAGQTGAPCVAHCVTASPPGPLRVRRSAVSSATPREAAAALTGPPCCGHTAACVRLSPSAPPWTAWVQGTLRLVFFFFFTFGHFTNNLHNCRDSEVAAVDGSRLRSPVARGPGTHPGGADGGSGTPRRRSGPSLLVLLRAATSSARSIWKKRLKSVTLIILSKRAWPFSLLVIIKHFPVSTYERTLE